VFYEGVILMSFR